MAFHIPTLNFLKDRKSYYKQVFGGPIAHWVLQDLSLFCRAAESTAVPGDRDKSLILAGRREVWLRIQQHLHLTEAQLYDLYGGPQLSEQRKQNG